MKWQVVNAGLLALISTGALAGTPEEYQSLNNWCTFTYNLKESGVKPTGATPPQPRDAMHFHHYCNGMSAISRMMSATKKYDLHLDYGVAEKEFEYVLANTPEDNYLIPELYAGYARAHMLVRSMGKATASLNKAIELDPKHTNAYVMLADVFVAVKRPDEARKVVQQAVQMAPINKGLIRQAKKFNVTIPEPEPAPAPAPVATVDTSGAPAEAVAATSSPGAMQPARAAHQPYMAPTEIGSPTNPWCRFCTDIPAAPAGNSPSMPGVMTTAPR